MKAIVAVNKKWAIGKNGDLLYSLPGDMRFFRETTKGKTVIMGRKTLDSFPAGAPLKNRVNIVISKKSDGKFIFDVLRCAVVFNTAHQSFSVLVCFYGGIIYHGFFLLRYYLKNFIE